MDLFSENNVCTWLSIIIFSIVFSREYFNSFLTMLAGFSSLNLSSLDTIFFDINQLQVKFADHYSITKTDSKIFIT